MRHVMPHAAVDPYLRRVQDPRTQRIQTSKRKKYYVWYTYTVTEELAWCMTCVISQLDTKAFKAL
jgi:hypothetical protein